MNDRKVRPEILLAANVVQGIRLVDRIPGVLLPVERRNANDQGVVGGDIDRDRSQYDIASGLANRRWISLHILPVGTPGIAYHCLRRRIAAGNVLARCRNSPLDPSAFRPHGLDSKSGIAYTPARRNDPRGGHLSRRPLRPHHPSHNHRFRHRRVRSSSLLTQSGPLPPRIPVAGTTGLDSIAS